MFVNRFKKVPFSCQYVTFYLLDNDYKKFMDQLENPDIGPTATPESYLEEIEQREREKGKEFRLKNHLIVKTG